MKKATATVFFLFMLILVCTGISMAAEDFPPPANLKGTIGNARTGAAWEKGIFGRIEFTEISAPTGNPATNDGWLYIKDNGGESTLYFESDAGNVTQVGASATAWDDIGDPDAAGTIAFAGYQQTLTSTLNASGAMFTYSNNTADLTSDVAFLDLKYKDDGDANGFFVRGYDNNGADLKFSIGADGVMVITGTAEGATAFTITGGDINLVDGDLVLQSGDINVTGDLTISGTASIGTILMDAVTASTGGATLALNGSGAGGVNIGAVSTGGITLSRTVTVADGRDVTIGEGVLTVDNDQAAETAIVVTSDATTAGGGMSITSAVTTTNGKALSITANDVTSGDLIYLESSATGMTTGNFINCYNGAATVFEVGLYGATTIAGNASTDIVTITAGDVQMTNGDIDMDEGKLEIDTTTNESSYIKRNQGTTTTPVLELEETAAAADNPVLLIDQNATAAGSYGLEIDTAGGTAVYLSLEAVTGDGIQFAVPAAYTGQLIKVSDTLVGTNGEGIIDINSSANIASGAALVKLSYDTGQLAGATNGYMLNILDTTTATGTSYAVSISTTNNEALTVIAGNVNINDTLLLNGNITSTLSSNAEAGSFSASAADYTTNSGIIQIYGSAAAGQTNASYLLRLGRKADGDAQDHFIQAVDNSTGAANDGDVMFSVNSGGAVTIAGDLTANGNITGDGATVFKGTLAEVVSGGAVSGYSVTIAQAGDTFYNAQATRFDLPEASTCIGATYTFVVLNASNLDVNPEASDLIVGATNAAGDMIRSATVGDTVTLQAVSASQWIVKSMYPASTDWTDAD